MSSNNAHRVPMPPRRSERMSYNNVQRYPSLPPRQKDPPKNDVPSQHQETAEIQTFPFFSLPRELRDLVYNLLWSSHPSISLPYSGKRSLLHFNPTHTAQAKTRAREQITYLPLWIFTSKTLSSEAASVLNEHGEWAYYSHELNHLNAGSAVLFGPHTSKTVTLNLSEIAGFSREIFTTYSLAARAKDVATDLSRVAEDMIACERVQRLCLWFDVDYQADVASVEEFAKMDVSIFDVFKHVPIESLVIYVEDAYRLAMIPERRYEGIWRPGLVRVAGTVLGVEKPKESKEKCWKTEKTWYHWLEYKKVG